jgi:hemerythrin
MVAQVKESRDDRRDIVFEMLNDVVVQHWAVEQRHLYPWLERLGYDHLQHSRELHRALCHGVAALRRVLHDARQRASMLNVVATYVEQHIADDQRAVLPFLAERIDRSTAHAIGEEMAGTVAEMENEDWLGTDLTWRERPSA